MEAHISTFNRRALRTKLLRPIDIDGRILFQSIAGGWRKMPSCGRQMIGDQSLELCLLFELPWIRRRRAVVFLIAPKTIFATYRPPTKFNAPIHLVGRIDGPPIQHFFANFQPVLPLPTPPSQVQSVPWIPVPRYPDHMNPMLGVSGGGAIHLEAGSGGSISTHHLFESNASTIVGF